MGRRRRERVLLRAAVGAREGCPHTGAAVVRGRRALRLPVSIARGFVVIRRPSRGAAFGVGRARGCLCLMALRCERRPAAEVRLARWVFACVAEACVRTDHCQRRSSRGSPLGGAKMTLSLAIQARATVKCSAFATILAETRVYFIIDRHLSLLLAALPCDSWLQSWRT